MIKRIFKGKYERKGSGVFSQKNTLEQEHPEIGSGYQGTVNVLLSEQIQPLFEDEIRNKAKLRKTGHYGNGNHICPTIRILSINGSNLNGFIYRGGHTDSRHIEMVLDQNIKHLLDSGDELSIVIGSLEDHEAEEVKKHIEDVDSKGDEFWHILHKMCDRIFSDAINGDK